MSEDLHPSSAAPRDADRRAHPRQIVRSLAYVELGERNGGIILNLSEGGMTVKAAMGLTETEIPRVRFELTQTRKSIETRGRISWTGGAKKTAGLQFIDLPDQALSDIREWIHLENSSATFPAGASTPSQPQTRPREATPHRQVTSPANGQISRQAHGRISEDVAGEQQIDERAVEEAIDRALRAVKKGAKAKQEAPVVGTQEPGSALPTLPQDRVNDPLTNRLTDLGTSSVPHANASPLVHSLPPATAKARPPINIPFSGHLGPLPPGKQAKIPSVAGISPDNAPPGLPDQGMRSWSRQAAIPAENEFRMPKYSPPPTQRPSVWSGRTLTFLGLFCFLAVGSLLAGWIAGRGTLNGFYDRISGKNPNVDQGEPRGDSTLADGNSGVSQIEIVNADNNRRMIPLSGPVSESTDGPVNTAVDAASASRNRESKPDLPAQKIPAGEVQTPSSVGTHSSQLRESQMPAAQSVSPTGTPPVQKAELLHWVEPSYPEEAIDQNVQGTVRLHVVVGLDGAVESVEPLSGAQLLIPAAIEAVRQWRYRPTLVDGKAVETTSDVSLVFTIPAAKPR